MTRKYSKKAEKPDLSVSTRGSDLRCHFKNTREAAMALKGFRLKKARRYLHEVISHKAAVPFRRFNGGVGRGSQNSLYRNCAGQVSNVIQ